MDRQTVRKFQFTEEVFRISETLPCIFNLNSLNWLLEIKWHRTVSKKSPRIYEESDYKNFASHHMMVLWDIAILTQ